MEEKSGIRGRRGLQRCVRPVCLLPSQWPQCWLRTTTTWRKLNCTHRQRGKTNEPTACRLRGYLTPNCSLLQIRPPTVVSPVEKLNVAAAPLSNCQNPLATMGTYVPIGWSHSAFSLQDLLHSLRLFQKWAILEVGSILQQCLAWRPIGRLATHHLFLGHCCPTSAQLMAPRPAANAAACTFAPQNCQEILRPFLTRKLCSSAADENSSSGSHHA